MERRDFLQLSAAAGITLGLPLYGYASSNKRGWVPSSDFEKLVYSLLLDWCEGMISVQVNNPEDLSVHGALYCPACNKIHGRCMDAVYPFLFMADHTGDQKYLKAAIEVMHWSENVSMPDGSWTVIPDPKSWRGITVFGAIALGEALLHHGHILPKEVHEKWTMRLAEAAEFIYRNITIYYSHINYAFTAIYALNFLGRMFDNETYIARSRSLAKEVPNWLTKPNKLIFGENQPMAEPSPKGLLPVDLGYNVEETLNGLVQYAVLEKDEDLLQLLTESMEAHLAFMLPDGAWDNSWGTRQNKWSYWGSRTTDGCQPAFGLMAYKNAAFGTAAYLSTELLKKCTVNGLLAGGPHYQSHGVKPCVHHTFTHAKSLAYVLDNPDIFRDLTKEKPVPRAVAKGVHYFPELEVWLASQGPWKATISSNDVIFKKPYSQAATGGALAVLWHQKVGPIFMASMAEYIMVEANNQQPQPDGEDIPLTPRIEHHTNGRWFSNLFDLKATVDHQDQGNSLDFNIKTQLTDRERKILPNGDYELRYTIDEGKTTITAKGSNMPNPGTALVLPVISPTGEEVVRVDVNRIEIQKISGRVVVQANVPLSILPTKKERVFNMVPGMEAVPIRADFSTEAAHIECTIRVE